MKPKQGVECGSWVERQVTASTQNQALNALDFFYQHVLRQPLGNLDGFVRAKRPQRLPVVLNRIEVGKLLAHMQGTHGLMTSMRYGTGNAAYGLYPVAGMGRASFGFGMPGQDAGRKRPESSGREPQSAVPSGRLKHW